MRRGYATTRFGQVHLRFFDPREREHVASAEDTRSRLPWAEPPLLCLHPFPYSGSFFGTIAPLLGKQRLVCAPDCPGFGGSDPPEHMFSMDELATAMLEAADDSGEFGREAVDLLGFHSGCLLAVEMARLKPERVRRMVLVDVPYFMPEQQAARYAKSTADTRYTADLSSLANAWEFSVAKRLDGMPFNRAFGNFVELLRAGERANWGYHATLTYDCAPRFRAVRHETLVVATQYMLKEHTRRAAAEIPGARFVERKDVTRAVMEEGAPSITQEVLPFLDN